ncbi:MAG: DUF4091 domain-containing protein [Candidatus Hydrogenedentes bacterium]|nr:DUF4091 domain-containing protein [Candidatus Hydrogenedentota bacterium]
MRNAFVLTVALCLVGMAAAAADANDGCILFDASYGERLPGSTDEVGLWWASSGWKVSKTRPIPKQSGRAIEISAARNEAEAAQLIVRPAKGLTGFLATSGALAGPAGATISAENVEVLRVRYVNVQRPSDITGAKAPWPDPLPPFKGPIGIAAGENQPLWVRVHVPREAAAGRYEGLIHLAADGWQADVPLCVRVYGFELPDRMTLTTAFGFNPGTVFGYQKISDPQQRHEVLEKYWAALSAHHISPYSPTPYHSAQVEWVKRSADEVKGLPEEDAKLLQEHALTPKFDWAAWDAEMERMFSTYHFNSFRLGIPGIASDLQGFQHGTRGHTLAFTAYCQAVQEHLREKGWLDEAYVYWFDEPNKNQYDHVMAGFRSLKEAAPDINRMLTEQVEPALVGGPNLWCPLSMWYGHAAAEERRAAGDIFWWYVCTLPKKPYCGLFTDHPGTDLRVWLWQTWQYKMIGVLVWHTNLWTTGEAYPDTPQNPYEDAMSWMTGYGTKRGEKKPWGNGDGRFMYPPEAAASGQQAETVLDGPVDSIRFEMLRDGIEDYEYLAILQRALEARKGTMSARKYRRYSKLLEVPESITSDLTTYTKDPAPIEKQRDRIARAIERLSRQ